jgi:mannose-1-phosphate guanylyltransferase/mannose-1-phosphate guanylyltransferase/mannose-6-phosphate isomerase
MIPVVLSGGSGTRLWPVSRASWPKPFCDLFDEPLYLKTLKRLLPLGSPWTVTVRALEPRTREACGQVGLPEAQVIYEPFGRNTAPAIALLCRLFALSGRGGEVVGIFPADHLVQDGEVLRQAVELGADYAAKGEVVTLGVTPTRPAVAFGYIETAGDAPVRETPCVVTAKRFVEKPDEATARRLLAAGNCLWNAGIFLFRVDTMIGHFQSLLPDLWRRMETIHAGCSNLESVYEEIEPLSFDHGILERLASLLCIPCDIGWSDVGSWEEVSALSGESTGTHVFPDNAHDNYIYPRGSKVYGLAGVDDLIIVDTDDALLVARKGQSQRVRQIVETMSRKGLPAATQHEHRFDTRPWGRYEVLATQDNFKAKLITVTPHARLSYQSHQHRDEHWIVVCGAGQVILEGIARDVNAGDYIFVAKGSRHRMVNPHDSDLQFVEVQLGSYFGEDDIARYEDDYQRLTVPSDPDTGPS